MKALSDCLYFTPKYFEDIQNSCIEELKYIVFDPLIVLISFKLISNICQDGHPRIGFLKNNFSLVKDYSTTPYIAGLDKVLNVYINLKALAKFRISLSMLSNKYNCLQSK